MKTLVLGLGNAIVSDDAVGPRVARELERALFDSEVVVMEAGVGGLGIVDLIAGFDRVIIIDAIQTRYGLPGHIYKLDARAFLSSRHTGSAHDVDFATALALAERLGMPLPREIIVFAVEATDVTTFSEQCTPEVERAIPECVDLIMHEIAGGSSA